MSLGKDEVQEIAHLARLAVDDEEIPTYVRDLSRILALVEQMNAVETPGVTPMAHPLDMEQRLRPDAVTEPNDREACLATAPCTRDGLYLVPRVID